MAVQGGIFHRTCRIRRRFPFHSNHRRIPPLTGPLPPPPPPAINLKFFGFANKAGEPKRIFLFRKRRCLHRAEGDIRQSAL